MAFMGSLPMFIGIDVWLIYGIVECWFSPLLLWLLNDDRYMSDRPRSRDRGDARIEASQPLVPRRAAAGD